MRLRRSTRLTILPLLLLPITGAAQQVRHDRADPEVTIISADGAGPDFDTRTLRHGFDLFANADGAFSGMRATGPWGTSFNNYGPCDGTFRNCQDSRVYVATRPDSPTTWASRRRRSTRSTCARRLPGSRSAR